MMKNGRSFFFFTNFYKLPSKSVNFLPYQMNVMEDVSATVQLSSLITRKYFRNGVKGLYYIIVSNGVIVIVMTIVRTTKSRRMVL